MVDDLRDRDALPFSTLSCPGPAAVRDVVGVDIVLGRCTWLEEVCARSKGIWLLGNRNISESRRLE